VYLEPQLTVDAVFDFQRWMAPEVSLCLPYGKKADVYSFGIFFYQLCTLKLPFGKITPEWHIRWVVKRATRPKIPLSVPCFLRDTMKACWSPEPSDRPSFKDICARLPDALDLTEQTNDLLDKSMHSTEHSMDGIHKQSQSSHVKAASHTCEYTVLPLGALQLRANTSKAA
jgi:hypothetical protein